MSDIENAIAHFNEMQRTYRELKNMLNPIIDKLYKRNKKRNIFAESSEEIREMTNEICSDLQMMQLLIDFLQSTKNTMDNELLRFGTFIKNII